MCEHEFVSVEELARFLLDHPNHEVGFTNDTREEIGYEDEATEWYGVVLDTELFNGRTLLFGYYGDGCVYADTHNIFNVEDVKDAIISFFGDRWYSPKEICVLREDMEV